MLRRSPVVDPAQLPGRKRRSWPFVVASGLAHLLFLILASGVLWQKEKEEEKKEDTKPKQVDMVFLPRPKKEKPLPKPKAPTAPPPKPMMEQPKPTPNKQPATPKQPPEKDPNAPAEAKAQSGNREPIGEPPKTLATNDPGQKAQEKPTLSTAPVATQESEAKRLFGAHAPADGQEPEAFSIRPFAMPGQGGEKCVPIQRFKRDENGRAPMGITVGRILQDDGVHPLQGAMLQMIGTPYVTFTDKDGEYKFTYDMSLIEDCRQQFVRVTADGFSPRMLTLIIGDKIRSDDVAMQRNGGGLPFGIKPRGGGGSRN